MALIVEDGTGLSNSESYASEIYADAYYEKRGNTSWSAVVDKEAALRLATDYMLQRYRALWRGSRVFTTQALDWPRDNVNIDAYTLVSNTIVPADIMNACCELALRSSTATLLPDAGQTIVRSKVDVIEVEYDKNSPQKTRYQSIDALLAPYLKCSSSVTMGLVRA